MCSTLYNHIRPVYPANTLAGKKARRILVDLQQICLSDPRCPRDLPRVSDCESPPPVTPTPALDFLGLFNGNNRDRVMSDEPAATSPPCTQLLYSQEGMF